MLIKKCCPGKENAHVIKIIQVGGYPGQYKKGKGNDVKYYGNPECIPAAKPGGKRKKSYLGIKVGIQAGINCIKTCNPEQNPGR